MGRRAQRSGEAKTKKTDGTPALLNSPTKISCTRQRATDDEFIKYLPYDTILYFSKIYH